MAVAREEDNLYTLEPFYVNKSQAEREREETKLILEKLRGRNYVSEKMEMYSM